MLGWLGSIACPSPAEGRFPEPGSAGSGLGVASGSRWWVIGWQEEGRGQVIVFARILPSALCLAGRSPFGSSSCLLTEPPSFGWKDLLPVTLQFRSGSSLFLWLISALSYHFLYDSQLFCCMCNQFLVLNSLYFNFLRAFCFSGWTRIDTGALGSSF